MSEKTKLMICIKDLNDRSLFINWSDNERKKLFNKLYKKMTQSDFGRLIEYDLPTISDVSNGKVKPSGYVYLSLLRILGLNNDITKLKISSRNHGAVRITNPYICPELLGLIHSDGHMNLNKKGNGVGFYFCNQNLSVIRRFEELIRITFSCSIKRIKDTRDDTYYVYVQSVVARIIARRIGWKNRDFKIPDLTKKEKPLYLKGLFDGDGTVYLYECDRYIIPTVRISMEFEYFACAVKRLLLDIGIESRICNEHSKGNSWWNVIVTKQKSFIKFAEKVGSNHPKKSKRLKEIRKKIIKRLSSVLPAR